MAITSSIAIVGVIAVIVVVVIFVLLLRSSRGASLTRNSGDQKPEWMRSTPPPETIAATKADGEGVTLYDYDQGENVAAPFAEQIEDILRSQLGADPYLKAQDVDFGTGPDGGLVFTIENKSYTSIDQIPNERLRAAIRQAVATYNERYGDKRSKK